MVSGFMCDDEEKGMGLCLDEGRLAEVNAFRALQLNRSEEGRAPLFSSPGIEYLDVGKNLEGWWNYECLAAQTTKMMDVYSALFPNEQILFEVDWSSGHAKFPTDALHAPSMNRGFGGGQPVPRDTTVHAVGNFPSTYTFKDSEGKTVVVDVGLQPGMVQSFTHKENDPPPLFTCNEKNPKGAPPKDVRKKKAKKKATEANPIVTAEESNVPAAAREDDSADAVRVKAALSQQMPGTGVPKNAEEKEEGSDGHDDSTIDAGYVGKPIGLATALFQRKLWNPEGMIMRVTSKNVKQWRTCQCDDTEVRACCKMREMVHVMSMQPDFMNQRSALEELIYSRGHLVIMSVKCHPEIAGNGIEYAWGLAKLQFRRRFNDRNLYRLHGRMIRSLAKELGVTWYALLETMRNKISTHRNIIELDWTYLIMDLSNEESVSGESEDGGADSGRDTDGPEDEEVDEHES